MHEVTPVIKPLTDDAELQKQFETWRQKRQEFMRGHEALDPTILKQAWQKFYFRGELPDSGAKAASHEVKLRLNEPTSELPKR